MWSQGILQIFQSSKLSTSKCWPVTTPNVPIQLLKFCLARLILLLCIFSMWGYTNGLRVEFHPFESPMPGLFIFLKHCFICLSIENLKALSVSTIRRRFKEGLLSWTLCMKAGAESRAPHSCPCHTGKNFPLTSSVLGRPHEPMSGLSWYRTE